MYGQLLAINLLGDVLALERAEDIVVDEDAVLSAEVYYDGGNPAGRRRGERVAREGRPQRVGDIIGGNTGCPGNRIGRRLRGRRHRAAKIAGQRLRGPVGADTGGQSRRDDRL